MRSYEKFDCIIALPTFGSTMIQLEVVYITCRADSPEHATLCPIENSLLVVFSQVFCYDPFYVSSPYKPRTQHT
jgi:hypothetical protein